MIVTDEMVAAGAAVLMQHVNAPEQAIYKAARAIIEVYKAAADETGWLIELEGNVPSYWALPTDDEGFWTNRAIDALRFSRKQDADAYINETGWTEAYASEHMWSAP